jgi:predicted Ser/Thr protein kinase
VDEDSRSGTADGGSSADLPTSRGEAVLDGDAVTLGSQPTAVGTPAPTGPGDAAIDDDSIPAGTVFGDRYEVRQHLGSGGMGTVYAAHDRLLDVAVALKFVRPQLARDPREQARLSREVRLAQAITHVNVIRTYTLAQHDGHLFIVMELLDGVSLAELLRAGPLPLPDAVRIVRDVLAGLAAAHAKNIVHRDIKPQNTTLCGDGRVVLMDFGIARATEKVVDEPVATAAPSQLTSLAGTPGYIAPEVVAGGPVTPQSDLYAVGVLLHQMVTGRLPSNVPTQSVQMHTGDGLVVSSDIPDLRHVPPSLLRVLARLLCAAPEARYASVAEVVAALDAADAPVVEPPPRRSWRGAIVAAGALAVVAIAGVALAGRGAALGALTRIELPAPVITPAPAVIAPAPASITPPPVVAPPAETAPAPAAPEPAPRRRPRRPATTPPAVKPTTPVAEPARTPPADDEAARRRRQLLDLGEE